MRKLIVYPSRRTVSIGDSLSEQGKTEPSINSICELCKIFEVSADYLLGLEDEDGRKLY